MPNDKLNHVAQVQACTGVQHNAFLAGLQQGTQAVVGTPADVACIRIEREAKAKLH
jgi:hypothetical protein